MTNEDSHAPTNVTGPQVAGTGSDPIHWKDKKRRKLREIVPMLKRKPLLLGQKK